MLILFSQSSVHISNLDFSLYQLSFHSFDVSSICLRIIPIEAQRDTNFPFLRIITQGFQSFQRWWIFGAEKEYRFRLNFSRRISLNLWLRGIAWCSFNAKPSLSSFLERWASCNKSFNLILGLVLHWQYVLSMVIPHYLCLSFESTFLVRKDLIFQLSIGWSLYFTTLSNNPDYSLVSDCVAGYFSIFLDIVFWPGILHWFICCSQRKWFSWKIETVSFSQGHKFSTHVETFG